MALEQGAKAGAMVLGTFLPCLPAAPAPGPEAEKKAVAAAQEAGAGGNQQLEASCSAETPTVAVDAEGGAAGTAKDLESGEAAKATPGKAVLSAESEGMEQAMERARQGLKQLPSLWCATALFGSWLPFLFFCAAANVLSSCEVDLAFFLRIGGLLAVFGTLGGHTLVVLTAATGNVVAFKLARALQGILTIALGTLAPVGWYYYFVSSGENCYDALAEHGIADINPRTALLFWLLLTLVCGVCFTCILCCCLGCLGRIALSEK